MKEFPVGTPGVDGSAPSKIVADGFWRVSFSAIDAIVNGVG